MLIKRSILALTVLAGTTLWAASPADAAPQHGTGLTIRPVPSSGWLFPTWDEWLGSYTVAGSPVWAADYQLQPPDSAARLTPAGTLTTKWGTPLDPELAARLSYLLWRYGSTTSADDAAALEHVVYRTTSVRQYVGQLGAYDVRGHLDGMPDSARAAVTTLDADAAANAGTWALGITPPNSAQKIGAPADWQVHLTVQDHAVPDVPVTLTATDATLPNGKSTQTIETTAGGPLTVRVTPTGSTPTIVARVDAPTLLPQALSAGSANVTRVLRATTTPLAVQRSAKAVAAPTSPSEPSNPASPSGPANPSNPHSPAAPSATSPNPAAGGTTQLSNTGTDVLLPLIIGLCALVVGGVLLVAGRRNSQRRR